MIGAAGLEEESEGEAALWESLFFLQAPTARAKAGRRSRERVFMITRINGRMVEAGKNYGAEISGVRDLKEKN